MTCLIRWAAIITMLAAIPGCGESMPTPAEPGRMDSGGSRADAALDARREDGSALGEDGSVPGEDGSVPGEDGSVPGEDGSVPGEDASIADAAVPMTDANSGGDAGCPPLMCPAPPAGCAYVGGTACWCGMLECPEPSCARCAVTQYCMSPAGTCSASGSCEARPRICPDIYRPVCGCDGVTYSNSCEAAMAGQSVAFEGECPEPSDCRTTGCPRTQTCEPCRGPRGEVYVCLPRGVAC